MDICTLLASEKISSNEVELNMNILEINYQVKTITELDRKIKLLTNEKISREKYLKELKEEIKK